MKFRTRTRLRDEEACLQLWFLIPIRNVKYVWKRLWGSRDDWKPACLSHCVVFNVFCEIFQISETSSDSQNNLDLLSLLQEMSGRKTDLKFYTYWEVNDLDSQMRFTVGQCIILWYVAEMIENFRAEHGEVEPILLRIQLWLNTNISFPAN